MEQSEKKTEELKLRERADRLYEAYSRLTRPQSVRSLTVMIEGVVVDAADVAEALFRRANDLHDLAAGRV